MVTERQWPGNGSEKPGQVASPVPAATRPLRTTRGHPRGLPHDRWLPRLPQAPAARVILL